MASLDLDLEEMMSHLGEFGKYQLFQYFLHVLAGFTAGLHMLTLLTVAATPNHNCEVPDIYRGNSSIDNNQCEYIVTKPGDNETFMCNKWTYNTTYLKSTVGMDQNFVCTERWRGDVAQTAYMLGVLAGAVTLGSMADKYGRKIIFCVSGLAQLILGVSVALVSNHYYIWLVLRFLYGIFGSAGAYITGFVLTMEMVGPSKRTSCGIIFQLIFALGIVTVALWGLLITDHVWLQIVYGLHGLLLIPHWWLMDESPRWLWAQGRVKEAVKIVQKALKMNGENIQLDEAALVSKSQAKQASKDNSGDFSAIDLLRTPNLRKKFLNVCLNWFANALCYYGITLSFKNLAGDDKDPRIMLALSALVEIPSYIFAIYTMEKLGRRLLISSFMLCGGICCIGTVIIPNTDEFATIAMIITLFGKACIALSFAVIYNYTAELFPTVLRNTAIGIGSMCCRFGGALTPLLMLLDSLGKGIPVTIFGVIALLSGFLSLFLPETAGQPMPESLEDGENFGIGDTCFTTCLGRKKTDDVYDVPLNPITIKETEKTSDTEEALKS